MQDYDYLQFYIDGTLKDQISGEVGWQQKSYSVDSGIHILKWRYVKDGSGYAGDDCGWVDFVQWTGPSPTQDPANWQEIAYKHDLSSRRIEKKVDGYSTRYVYDGPHVIAEYDGNNKLLRKYTYGPGIDKPVCMIEIADANATYYYHFDALGSVVALSDASGDTVQTYEYSVYGEVAVEDANHTNPYMFAGVRYDIEIGLYYNRARYYNPYTGRFLQADPIGYEAGMNLYWYCGNNPLSYVDPSGLSRRHSFLQPGETGYKKGKLTLAYWVDGVLDLSRLIDFNSLDEFYAYGEDNDDVFNDLYNVSSAGWELSGGDKKIFLAIKALEYMYVFSADEISSIEDAGWRVKNNSKRTTLFGGSADGYLGTTIYWDPTEELGTQKGANWNRYPAIAGLAHELGHAYNIVKYGDASQESAIKRENMARYFCYTIIPQYNDVWPRPLEGNDDLGWTLGGAWKRYWRTYRQ